MKFIISFLINLIIIMPIQFIIKENINIKYPFFYIGNDLYYIFNIIVIISISISTAIVLKNSSYKVSNLSNRYIFIHIINILIFLTFLLFSFRIISPFLSFSFSLFSFIASLYLQEETVYYNKNNNWLIPYIIWTFYLTLLNMSVFIVNQ